MAATLTVFKAIDLLGGGLDVTRTGMELGYGSTSAFVYAFRTEMGCSPRAYMRGRVAGRGAPAIGHNNLAQLTAADLRQAGGPAATAAPARID